MENEIFTPKTDVEDYLNNEFNIEIYEVILEGAESPLSPLEFLNLLYKVFQDVKANRKKPLAACKYIKESISKFDEDNKVYFYEKLIKLLCAEYDAENNALIKFVDIDYQTVIEPLIKENDEYFSLSTAKFYFTDYQNFLNKDSGIVFEFGENPFRKKERLAEKRVAEIQEKETTEPQLGKYTNSQLVLIFYYFFKLNGLTPRETVDIAPIAKFLHLITGKNFTGTANSDFYNKLKTAPNFKSEKELINDLETIKPLFEMVQLKQVVKMIDNEIGIAHTERKTK